MKNDTIKCLNCGKEFKDDTKQTDKLTEAGNIYQWTGQDSRTDSFRNMCPFCYSTNTKNTHEKTKNKQKFIYEGDHRNAGANKKMSKKIAKPNLNTEHLTLKTLGQRKTCDIREEDKDFAPSFQRTLPKAEPDTGESVEKHGGTFDTSPVKSFTPIELMERNLKAQHKELLLPPDNRRRYRGWRYDRRLKK